MSRRRVSRQRRQEGAALLIVLFILMMATGTAMFSLQSTQFEQRAAGALQQAMRTRYVAEGATVSVLAYCYELGPTGCADLKRAASNVSVQERQRYALPSWGGQETMYQITADDLVGTTFPVLDASTKNRLLPPDSKISGGGTATAFTPSFVSVMEKWEVPNPGETRPRFRLIVSTYGQLSLPAAKDVKGTDELRLAHESISATRAFFDVR